VLGACILERVFNVVLREEDRGYSVQCIELPQAISQGETREEALANIKDAIQLVLKELEERAVCPPEKCRKEIVVV
jgi:predicted RNase H-like HicB family nuclease